MSLECEICWKPAEKNSVVCSDKCNSVRLFKMKLNDKYFPTHGCENCWGDLHIGCTEECVTEFKKAHEFSQDLWALIELIYPRKRG